MGSDCPEKNTKNRMLTCLGRVLGSMMTNLGILTCSIVYRRRLRVRVVCDKAYLPLLAALFDLTVGVPQAPPQIWEQRLSPV
jgi:tetrahydromethanopterin S-methyltransferase subunit E